MVIKLCYFVFVLKEKTFPSEPVDHDANEMNFIVDHGGDKVEDVRGYGFSLVYES
jgi:hypothetical protein